MTLPKIKMERPSVYNRLDWLIGRDRADGIGRRLARALLLKTGRRSPTDHGARRR